MNGPEVDAEKNTASHPADPHRSSQDSMTMLTRSRAGPKAPRPTEPVPLRPGPSGNRTHETRTGTLASVAQQQLSVPRARQNRSRTRPTLHRRFTLHPPRLFLQRGNYSRKSRPASGHLSERRTTESVSFSFSRRYPGFGCSRVYSILLPNVRHSRAATCSGEMATMAPTATPVLKSMSRLKG